MKTVAWLIIPTLVVCICCYFFSPIRSEGIADAAVSKNGDIAFLVRLRKELLVEPFEESLFVRKAGFWNKYYVDHEASFRSSTHLIIDDSSIHVVRGKTLIARYELNSGLYIKDGKILQPISKHSFASGLTLEAVKTSEAEPAGSKTTGLDP
jgi:hypothetical protein